MWHKSNLLNLTGSLHEKPCLDSPFLRAARQDTDVIHEEILAARYLDRTSLQEPRTAMKYVARAPAQGNPDLAQGLQWTQFGLSGVCVCCLVVESYDHLRCSMHSISRYLVPGTCQVPCTRHHVSYLVPRTWYLVPSSRYLVFGTKYIVPSTRHPVPGTGHLLASTNKQVPSSRGLIRRPGTW